MISKKNKIDTPILIIGAGMAGLCVSYFLTKKKIEHIILEKGSVGNSWINERWDNFYLVNPNWAMKIPEFDIHSNNFKFESPDGFLNKQEVINYIESFAKFIGPKIYENEKAEKVPKKKDKDSLNQLSKGHSKFQSNTGCFKSVSFDCKHPVIEYCFAVL